MRSGRSARGHPLPGVAVVASNVPPVRELIVDDVITKHELREQLSHRLAVTATKRKDWPDKKRGVTPV